MGAGITGPSQIEEDYSRFRPQYQQNLQDWTNHGLNTINQGIGGINQLNGSIGNYMGTIGNTAEAHRLQDMISGMSNGQGISTVDFAGMNQAQGATATAGQATATGLGMRGGTFAEQFGGNLGQFNLQQQNMESVAQRLTGTDNPFAVLTNQAMEDSALQNASGMDALRAQLASQGLDPSSGTGAAALAALAFNSNNAVNSARRQNAVQGAQFQQQGLGMAGNLYSQLAGLDLQRATTQGQLGLQGYQADIANAGRMDQVGMANAANMTQANIASAGNQTQASIANMQGGLQAALANAAAGNSFRTAGLQAALGMYGMNQDAMFKGFGLQAGNYGNILQAGSGMFNSAVGGQSNYFGNLQQGASGAAQGRGQFWGGLLGGGLGLLGAFL